MKTFKPDLWLLFMKDSHLHILGSWRGSFDVKDYWRRSTQIVSTEHNGDKLTCVTASGTQYVVYPDNYGSTGWAGGVLAHTIVPDHVFSMGEAMFTLFNMNKIPVLTNAY